MLNLFNSNHSDYFGRKKSFFNKSYIDYCLKEIIANNKLKEEEIKIVKNANSKYKGFLCINLFLFFCTCRRIYKKGLYEFRIDKAEHRIINNFYFNSILSIFLMMLVYKQAQMSYYNDLKYLIMKYKNIKKEQYYDAELNKKIYDIYEKELTEKIKSI
jgi:hypothetical protein